MSRIVPCKSLQKQLDTKAHLVINLSALGQIVSPYAHTMRELQPKAAKVNQKGSADFACFVRLSWPALHGEGAGFPLLTGGL